jgi:hypothetical protein
MYYQSPRLSKYKFLQNVRQKLKKKCMKLHNEWIKSIISLLGQGPLDSITQ